MVITLFTWQFEFYVMAQFRHFFCSIFHILNDSLQPPIQWMFLSCLDYIGSSYAPTIFMDLGVLWPHMYDFQALSPYFLHFWANRLTVFTLFLLYFFDNLFPKWYLRALLFIQPINVSELSEVDCKSIVQLFIVSKVLGSFNHWK